jgi:hypothetical protein
MRGRYLLTSPVEVLRQLFMFEQRPNLMPRWGLVPFWAVNRRQKPTFSSKLVRSARDGIGKRWNA